jgi:hypothetical protein
VADEDPVNDHVTLTNSALVFVKPHANTVAVRSFGGGFYCGLLQVGEKKKPLYVLNGFFMAMRSKFVGKRDCVHFYEVEWDASKLSWADFRSRVLGTTDPAMAVQGSIRHTIHDKYKEFGLAQPPNKGDNGVHGSASPLEGLAEKANWRMLPFYKDAAFGKACLACGITKADLTEWSKDPTVTLPGSRVGSLFDALEDMNALECLETLKVIKSIQQAKLAYHKQQRSFFSSRRSS